MIIDNSCLGLANTQDERFTLVWLSRSKRMTVDVWIRDYNPPRCFQKKISGRGKHNGAFKIAIRDHSVRAIYKAFGSDHQKSKYGPKNEIGFGSS
jgi:hypothetical protein